MWFDLQFSGYPTWYRFLKRITKIITIFEYALILRTTCEDPLRRNCYRISTEAFVPSAIEAFALKRNCTHTQAFFLRKVLHACVFYPTFLPYLRLNTVTDGVWIGNRIYWIFVKTQVVNPLYSLLLHTHKHAHKRTKNKQKHKTHTHTNTRANKHTRTHKSTHAHIQTHTHTNARGLLSFTNNCLVMIATNSFP
jgi:hypothetical protein